MEDKARTLLKSVFGYNEFRPSQEEIIHRVLADRDTLAVLPTGGGKSLCYQIPALVRQRLAVVVSPLIALMQDQVAQLRAVGVEAAFLNSTLDSVSWNQAASRVEAGKVRLLYAAPESLFTERLQGLLRRTGVSLLTVDEAHCISEWGHEFRPEYRRLAELRKSFPQATCLALTATATPKVRADIRSQLGIQEEGEIVAGFDRPNLRLEVRPKLEPRRQLLSFLETQKGEPGIVYGLSRKTAEDLATFLSGHGFAARPYHAGLADDDRRRNQEAFLKDDVQVVCATTAFGMGINKPNVRFVVHYDAPKSLEAYYQEVGRAGRDGAPGQGLFLYSYADVRKLEAFLEKDASAGPLLDEARRRLKEVADFAETTGCRRRPLLAHFGETREGDCENCDNCLHPGPREDMTVPAQKLLSCAIRTGERFGAAYLAAVLTGNDDASLAARGHNSLSVYGIGKDWDVKRWMLLSKRLEQAGLLDRSPEFGGLEVSSRGREVLRSRSPIVLPSLPEIAKTTKKPRERRESTSDPRPEGGLFEHLRRLRKTLADEGGVPPYVVFSDRTLADMVDKRPFGRDAFLEVFGVGKQKADKYADVFLEAIRTYGES